MELRERIAGLMPQARDELSELVAMRSGGRRPSVSSRRMCRCGAVALDKFKEVGFSDVHLAETADGSRAVVGSRPGADSAAPTVLLYSHYDVQPPLDESAWRTPPFQLTEVDGRWYGRGAADCKGNIVVHLMALRALGDDVPVNLKLVFEGSEEQGTGGLEDFVPKNAGLLRADAILVCDTGNAAVGHPAATVSLRGVIDAVVTVRALESEMHSGMFGGAAPDAMAGLIEMLATLRDEKGNTTIRGLDNTQTWTGESYPPEQFRADAGVLDGVSLLGDGSVSDMLWARPAITILGFDCPPVLGSTAAIVPRAAARLNLRIPPGTEPDQAFQALVDHLQAAAPWGVQVTVELEAKGQPFKASTTGPAYDAISSAMMDAFGKPMSTLGQGGSIPLCNVFAETYPDAELIMMGVEEPAALIHAANESVAPSEIQSMALVEALFMQRYATAKNR